ncbi:MAG: ferritin family protein [Candidatus Margulisiibacteriota bacterium]|jgi:rubrerythrin
MNYNIAVEDIVKMAIKIEENGEMVYRYLTKQFEVEEIKQLFKLLADQETYHRSYFEGLLSTLIKGPQSQMSLDRDKLDYLKGFAGEHVFLPDNVLALVGKKIGSKIEVFDFALLAEKETAEFYEKLLGLIPVEERAGVERIIVQERNHYQILTKEKEKIINSGGK